MSFLGEIKRRKAFQVAAVYAVVAWLLIQVADVVLPAFEAPTWVLQIVIFLLILGFPITLIMSWAFNLTPEGLVRESSSDAPAARQGRTIEYVLIGLLVIAVGWLVYRDIGRTETPIEEHAVAATTADRKSVAVLPFANRSNDEDDAFFVHGIHDDILTQLAKISSLKVISRTSVMGYRDTIKNMKTIGEELGVATLLQGGVQRAGDRVRIGVQLIDTNTDEHLWAETYDRVLTAQNIFAIQSEMASEIAAALQATLSPDEQERLKRVPTENMAALEAYFRAKQHMAGRTSEGLAMAVNDFQQAISLDPAFALAYLGLSSAYGVQSSYGGSSVGEMNARRAALIDQALALDDQLSEAYTARAGVFRNSSGDYAEEEAAHKRALTLGPNNATAHLRYASFLRREGRFEEALVFGSKAAELDPRAGIIHQAKGNTLEALGRFDDALAEYEKVIEIAPRSPLGYRAKALLEWLLSGRLDDAERFFQQASNIDPDTPGYNFERVMLLWDLGDDEQLECWTNHTALIAPKSFFTYQALQILYLVRGDASQALDNANKALMVGIPVFDNDRGSLMSLALLRDRDMANGDFTAARDRYEKYYPKLLGETRSAIGRANKNYLAAIDLARVLQETGEQERANRLLSESLAYIQEIRRLGFEGHGIGDVHIYALQGETEKALAALRQAIDAGWRGRWRYLLETNDNIESLRNEPRFQAMVEEIKADMASQLARVKDMEPIGQVCAGA